MNVIKKINSHTPTVLYTIGFVVIGFLLFSTPKCGQEPVPASSVIIRDNSPVYDKVEPGQLDAAKVKDLRLNGQGDYAPSEAINYDPFQSTGSTARKAVSTDLGDGQSAHFVLNKTGSFATSAIQASAYGDNKDILVLDKHFNAAGGKASGFMMLSNTAGKKFASALNGEYKKIYDENGWGYDQPNLIVTARQHRLGMLNQTGRRGVAAVIDEFAYRNDSKNGRKPIEWMQTEVGQRRIALAQFAAMKSTGFKHYVCFAGHWATNGRGTGGTSYNGWHESPYAFAVHNKLCEFSKCPHDVIARCMSEICPPYPHQHKVMGGAFVAFATLPERLVKVKDSGFTAYAEPAPKVAARVEAVKPVSRPKVVPKPKPP